MANPYHDSEGKFCSKGEMVAEMKQLAKSGDFTAYFNLRKSYDEILASQNLTRHESIMDELDNRIKLSVKTKEASFQSYELVKDKLGDERDTSYVSHLLSSPYLSPEVREDIIASASLWALRETVERDSYSQATLSYTDYENIVKRENSEEVLPVIAKNHRLRFFEKKSLLSGSPWGVALLAIHNKEEFFKDAELVSSLRDDADKIPHNSGLTSLALSPFEEDHDRVLNSNKTHKGYLSAAIDLSRNPSLSISNARKLIQNSLDNNDSSVGTIVESIRTNNERSEYRVPSIQASIALKGSYSDENMTPSKRVEIEREISSLSAVADKKFDSEESRKRDFLLGKLYANDSDYKAALKTYKKLKTIGDKKITPEQKKERGMLYHRILYAKNIRDAYFTLRELDSYLS